MVIHQLAANDDLITDFDISLTALVLFVTEIHSPEHLESPVGSSVLRYEE